MYVFEIRRKDRGLLLNGQEKCLEVRRWNAEGVDVSTFRRVDVECRCVSVVRRTADGVWKCANGGGVDVRRCGRNAEGVDVSTFRRVDVECRCVSVVRRTADGVWKCANGGGVDVRRCGRAEVRTCGGADVNATVFRCFRHTADSGVQVSKIQYGHIGKTKPLTSPIGTTHSLSSHSRVL